MWQENIMTGLFLFHSASKSPVNSRMHNLSDVASLCEVATLSLSGISRMRAGCLISITIKATHISTINHGVSWAAERIKRDKKWCKGWALTPSGLLTSAPLRRRLATTLAWPAEHAKCIAVRPAWKKKNTNGERCIYDGEAQDFIAETDIDAPTSLMPEMRLWLHGFFNV